MHGRIRWCQGYSEPGAGSDLASVQTKCEDMGDHFRINGQKIWTSYADKSDWIFCLVRTDPDAPKHEGISFVLIDMDQPGVRTSPIQLISGSSPFCQTFFEDARAEKHDLVGPLNGGWTVAKRLLQFERQLISGIGSVGHRRKTATLDELAKRHHGARRPTAGSPTRASATRSRGSRSSSAASRRPRAAAATKRAAERSSAPPRRSSSTRPPS